MPYNDSLREELLAMARQDLDTRAELAADGSLFDGYHPRMEEIHKRNGARLSEIIEQYGWPGPELVKEDGAEAAWLIAQHAIGNPELQRRVLALIKVAAAKGAVPMWQMAMLEDRVRMFEGRLQLYGTQFDWDDNGEMSPFPPIKDRENVDERRRAVGLRPLEEDIKRQRAAVAQTKERPPQDLKARREEMEEWARSVGWRA